MRFSFLALFRLITALFFGVLLCGIDLPATATDIKVEYVEEARSSFNSRAPGFNLTVSWDNAWRNDRNHDAGWVFLKYNTPGEGYEHVRLVPDSGEMLWKADPSMPDADIRVADNRAGILIRPSDAYRGDLQYHIYVEQDTTGTGLSSDFDRLEAFATEMVYIPEGPFTLGDPDPAAREYGAYFRSGADGSPDGLYEIDDSGDIPVGPESGQLYYNVSSAQYQGDQSGPIPADFPSGYDAFYLMKYEVTQGQYVDFLNTLPASDATERAPYPSAEYTERGGSIRLVEGRYETEHPDRRNVYWHWDDMMAFTDWAGLRPYTEFEYTKAARGPLDPTPLEYAWNTGTIDDLRRRIDPENAKCSDARRNGRERSHERKSSALRRIVLLGDGPFGSMWEKVITPADSVGRTYTGTRGDGIVESGRANVASWPSGTSGSAGYGYRGGGYYGQDAYTSDFVPYSPIAFRRYGAWSGGGRNAAYGYRAAF